ncbi:formylglycine-generating enzyme family protein [Paeniglutamicibacter sp. R2-26]|uniref:formylglycine-generating enzyme family protein n=1 Tax=Paeniglutamicibacter sp. R2-26 TaxID=3144417 RepID=UPI003EE78FC8
MTSNGIRGASPEQLWVRLPGGRFSMGSYDFYPDEAPVHQRTLAPFDMMRGPVTNAQYGVFVGETGYVTLAERGLDEAAFAHLPAEERGPGSLVFVPTGGPVDLRDWRAWWAWVPGAQWRHPLGPDSDLTGKENHPVVQIAHGDALAYARWLGARLPTEAEHEFAAGGGLAPNPYAWGRDRDPAGVAMANTWHGRFPYLNSGAGGWVGTSPVGAFPPNGFGLEDCIGNVWEWTGDHYTESHALAAGVEWSRGVEPGGVHGGLGAEDNAGSGVPRRVLKGGSHLSAPEYCLRYRPAARWAQAEDSATNHIGFRCVRDLC